MAITDLYLLLPLRQGLATLMPDKPDIATITVHSQMLFVDMRVSCASTMGKGGVWHMDYEKKNLSLAQPIRPPDEFTK